MKTDDDFSLEQPSPLKWVPNETTYGIGENVKLKTVMEQMNAEEPGAGPYFGPDVLPPPLTDKIIACPWCGKLTPTAQEEMQQLKSKVVEGDGNQ